jgi:hypothetical protein
LIRGRLPGQLRAATEGSSIAFLFLASSGVERIRLNPKRFIFFAASALQGGFLVQDDEQMSRK